MQRRTSIAPQQFGRDVWEHVEALEQSKAHTQKSGKEAERLARLGKARAALDAALQRLAKAKQMRHHGRLPDQRERNHEGEKECRRERADLNAR